MNPANPVAFVVEDDISLAEIFSQALQAAEYNVVILHDGHEALSRLKIEVPDLVLLDLHLPRVPGEQVLHAIRSDPRQARTCIILATADALLAEMMHREATMILIKPISFIQLRDLAARLRIRIVKS